ncbi:AAA family ATPase [Micromonospora chokoriensis]
MGQEESRPAGGGSRNSCTDDSTGIVTDALTYAADGFYVFPVRYDTEGEEKKNFTALPDWRNTSTTSPDQIRKWFGPGGEWEGDALAIDCARSGLVVVDLDVSKGKRGPEEWAALDASPTWRVRTPTGGEHWYYREDPARPVGNDQSGKLAPGVDVRGLGGLVIAPPTVDGRGAYRWVEGMPQRSELPTVPPVVVERMTKRTAEQPARERHAPAAAPSTTYNRTPWTPHQADREINHELDRLASVQPGSRNGELNNAAMRLGHFVPHYLPMDTAVALLTERARGIRLDESEILPTINSGLSAGMRTPFTVAADTTGQGTPEPAVDAVEALLSRMLDRDALDKIPAPTPLIRDVLDLDSESWVIGAPGGFKSFVALDWACHVALGIDWRGKPVTQGRVVYVAAEGHKGIPLRVKAWEAMNGKRIENVLFLPEPVQVKDGQTDRTGEYSAAWRVLVEACRRLEPVLIVLDTQARITVGLEENDAKAMGFFIDAVGALKRATGACVLVVHHTGRNGEDARGSSALDGAQDTEIKVKRSTGKARADLTATIGTDKQKDGDESVGFEIQLQKMDLGTDPETGRPLSSLALKPHDPFAVIERQQPDWTANLTVNQADVIGVMHDHSDESGATRSQGIAWVKARRALHGQVAMQPESWDSAVKALVSAGLIVRHGRGRIVLAEYAEADE